MCEACSGGRGNVYTRGDAEVLVHHRYQAGKWFRVWTQVLIAHYCLHPAESRTEIVTLHQVPNVSGESPVWLAVRLSQSVVCEYVFTQVVNHGTRQL